MSGPHPALTSVITAGVEDITTRGTRGSEAIAQTVLARVAHEAYRLGHRAAIRDLITTEDAAAALGITVAMVRRAALRLGVGWQVSRGTWLFQPEDIDRLRARGKPGRPKATAE